MTTVVRKLEAHIWQRRAPLAACLMLTAALMGSNAVAESFSDGIQAFHRQDYVVAMRNFRPLAEQGEARAQFFLGYMYDRGWGVPRSAAQAASWFRKAAEQGHAVSQASLATAYFSGDGVSQNYLEAAKWYLKAAGQGDASAQSGLATIYKNGLGVPQNYILAYMWLTVSAHDPDYEPGAKIHREVISVHMAPSQIAEAQKLAQQCLQSNFKVCNQAP